MGTEVKEISQTGKYQHGGHAERSNTPPATGSKSKMNIIFIVGLVVVFSVAGFLVFNSKATNTPKITAAFKPDLKAVIPAAKPIAPKVKSKIIAIKPKRHTKHLKKSVGVGVIDVAQPVEPVTASQVTTPATEETDNADSDTTSLDEMIVMGVASGKKNKNAATAAVADKPVSTKVVSSSATALPQVGWSSFNKYLKDNAVSPDGKTGVVKLSFTVAKDGVISDIKILKGLSPEADKKAIDLINTGPDWSGSNITQAETVKVKVKFSR